ncbi:MAG: hypothetical protein ACXVPQ_03485 [Bacteroidia bacterium]
MKKTLLLILLSSVLNAQNAAETIQNINKAFYKDEKLVMDIESLEFDNAKQTGGSKVKLYQLNENKLYKAGAAEALANDKYMINIDHNKKTMIVSPVIKHKRTQGAVTNLFEQGGMLDSLLKHYKDVSIKQVNETTNTIIFVFKKGKYETVSVSYNPNTFRISEYSIFLKPMYDKLKHETHQYSFVIRTSYADTKELSKYTFDASTYFIAGKNKLLPAGKFKGYTIIDNINKTPKSI